MRVTQGTFSFLPDLTDEQIEVQIVYALRNGWAISLLHCVQKFFLLFHSVILMIILLPS